MNNTLVIIGAGGHGRVCAEIAEISGYREVVFLDDREIPGVKIVGSSADIDKFIDSADLFVGIGDNLVRHRISEEIIQKGGRLATLIHPSSVLSPTASVGVGAVVMAGTVINAGAKIGNGAIINTCSSVDHDCEIGDYSHISVGAHLAGSVSVGRFTFIGAGAVIINNISVCEKCMVGAGAAMVDNANLEGVYVGVPARRIK